MTEVLNTTGIPMLAQQQGSAQLDPGDILKIQITENINAAKCSVVTIEYRWDGGQFTEVAQSLNPSIGCNTQN